MALPENNRRLADASLRVTAALPNAAATVNTNSIDLGVARPFPIGDHLTVQIKTTDATGANSKNLSIVLQDSDDGSNFASIPTLGAVVIAEDNGSYAATTANIALPPEARRYIRASVTGEADGGNASDGSLTLQLVF